MTDRKRQIERMFKQHYWAMFRLASIILHDDEESMHVYLRSQHGLSRHHHPPGRPHPVILAKKY